jgi:hypothetical protein
LPRWSEASAAAVESTWQQFLRAQAHCVLACHFLHVNTVLWRRVYVFFVIEVDSTRVHILGISRHPSGPWVAQQARNPVMGLGERAGRFKFWSGIATRSSPRRSTRCSPISAPG